jgi:hypothetical protein
MNEDEQRSVKSLVKTVATVCLIGIFYYAILSIAITLLGGERHEPAEEGTHTSKDHR